MRLSEVVQGELVQALAEQRNLTRNCSIFIATRVIWARILGGLFSLQVLFLSLKLYIEREVAMRLKKILLITLAIVGTATAAFAHSGGTNSQNCHNNHKTGGYHCH